MSCVCRFLYIKAFKLNKKIEVLKNVIENVLTMYLNIPKTKFQVMDVGWESMLSRLGFSLNNAIKHQRNKETK